LIFLDSIAHFHFDGDDLTFMNAFAQIGQFEFSHV